MTFNIIFQKMKSSIQDALDVILSPRSSYELKGKALQALEKHLALACFPTSQGNDKGARDSFLALQYTFECNIPARLLPWVTQSTARLEYLTNKGTVDSEKVAEVGNLTSLLATSLSLLQGIALIHEPTKQHLGRKAALEILLELLLTSRHLTPERPDKSIPGPAPVNLSANVIDTLLCVMVDTSSALRAFEDAKGVQAVVKILKRAGTPREVRMKCLEFLYFYLLDESPDANPSPAALQQLVIPTPPPTAPATPIRDGKPHLTSQPQHPTSMSRYGSSNYALSGLSGAFSITSNSTASDCTSPRSLKSSVSASTSSSRSLRSLSDCSNTSYTSSASSVEAVSLPPSSPIQESHKVFTPPPSAALSVSSNNVQNLNKPLPPITNPRSGVTHKSPIKRNSSHSSNPSIGSQLGARSPPRSPQANSSNASNVHPIKATMMLKKEVDYTPMSPKKVANVTPIARRPGHRKSLSTSTLSASSSSASTSFTEAGQRVLSSGLRPRGATHFNVTQEPPVPVVPSQYRQSKQRKEDGEKENVRLTPPMSLKDLKESDDEMDRATWKTTEEKKHLLGTMLGNVDALVEGVRKAGIWGLA